MLAKCHYAQKSQRAHVHFSVNAGLPFDAVAAINRYSPPHIRRYMANVQGEAASSFMHKKSHLASCFYLWGFSNIDDS